VKDQITEFTRVFSLITKNLGRVTHYAIVSINGISKIQRHFNSDRISFSSIDVLIEQRQNQTLSLNYPNRQREETATDFLIAVFTFVYRKRP